MTYPSTGMVLAPQEVGHYLLRRGLTNPAAVVDSDLEIVDSSRRNCNVLVRSRRGASYLLKQGLDEHNAATVRHEAIVYRLLAEAPASDPLVRFLPRCHDYDADTGILVLELLPDALNLREHVQRRRRCSVRLAREFGRALAALHGFDVDRLRASPDLSLPAAAPWALRVCRPSLRTFQDASGGAIRILRTTQRFPGIGQALDELNRTWQPDALIHGDLRWDNCVVHTRRAEHRSNFKLVDWEFADLGESAWDVGSAFAEYLSCWLRSIPISGRSTPAELIALADFPLDRIQPAIVAFWESYVKWAGLAPAAAEPMLLRAIRFCGVKLIQAAYEYVAHMSDLDAHAAVLLQMGQNVLERPAVAGRHVLGLPTTLRAAP